jgi:hypothetical protein
VAGLGLVGAGVGFHVLNVVSQIVILQPAAAGDVALYYVWYDEGCPTADKRHAERGVREQWGNGGLGRHASKGGVTGETRKTLEGWEPNEPVERETIEPQIAQMTRMRKDQFHPSYIRQPVRNIEK